MKDIQKASVQRPQWQLLGNMFEIMKHGDNPPSPEYLGMSDDSYCELLKFIHKIREMEQETFKEETKKLKSIAYNEGVDYEHHFKREQMIPLFDDLKDIRHEPKIANHLRQLKIIFDI